MMPKGLRRAAVLSGVFVLSACGHSASTRLFTVPMSPPSGVPVGLYGGAPIRVDAVHIPPVLDRIELVDEISPGEFRIDDFDHWAAPLGRISREAMTEDLAARLPAGAVIFSNGPRYAAAKGVSVDILSFRIGGGVATMQVSWTRFINGDPTPRQSSATFERAVLTPSPAGTSRVFGDLLGELADRIVAQLNAPTD